MNFNVNAIIFLWYNGIDDTGCYVFLYKMKSKFRRVVLFSCDLHKYGSLIYNGKYTLIIGKLV